MGDYAKKEDIEKLHGRVNDLSSRVVSLEAQRPHIAETLDEIKDSIGRLNGHLVRAVWVVLALFITALWKIIANGGLPGI